MVYIWSHHAQLSMRDAVLLKTTMEMVPLLNIVTGKKHSNHELLGQNKLIFEDQPAYVKANDRLVVASTQNSITVLFLWYVTSM